MTEDFDTSARRHVVQAGLDAAANRHSTAAGAKQAPLATPLSPAELYAGGGFEVGITDVDCTPRPRYGESQARFEARMARMGVHSMALGKEVQQRNREAALRHVDLPNGYERWWTVCACGFCGLRVDDPEVARREYDAHACAAAGVGEAAVDRAIYAAAHPHAPLVKRASAVLQPSIPVVTPETGELERMTADVQVDETEERMALLEGIPK